jgi:hypothetical protein
VGVPSATVVCLFRRPSSDTAHRDLPWRSLGCERSSTLAATLLAARSRAVQSLVTWMDGWTPPSYLWSLSHPSKPATVSQRGAADVCQRPVTVCAPGPLSQSLVTPSCVVRPSHFRNHKCSDLSNAPAAATQLMVHKMKAYWQVHMGPSARFISKTARCSAHVFVSRDCDVTRNTGSQFSPDRYMVRT